MQISGAAAKRSNKKPPRPGPISSSMGEPGRTSSARSTCFASGRRGASAYGFGFVLEAADMVSSSGPASQGGGAVAQPARARSRLDTACLAAFAVATLGLAIWAAFLMRGACGGKLGAPLDDSYIHFQFARSFAR